MRENAAMHGGADRPKASAAALLPVALVAAVVLAVALVVKGGETGTIVIERTSISAFSTENGRTEHAPPSYFTEITEAAADGTEQRTFIADSLSRPGFQQLSGGRMMQLYDPLNNTVFETTLSAWKRAVDAEMGIRTSGTGSSVRQVSAHFYSLGSEFGPGRESIPQQQLRAHQSRISGRTTIDGRPALELIQHQQNPLPSHGGSTEEPFVSIEYVEPGTYDPIEEITKSTFAGIKQTVIDRWASYTVLPADSKTQRLVSLTARHPGARIVISARGYVQADQSEIRTVHVSSGS